MKCSITNMLEEGDIEDKILNLYIFSKYHFKIYFCFSSFLPKFQVIIMHPHSCHLVVSYEWLMKM